MCGGGQKEKGYVEGAEWKNWNQSAITKLSKSYLTEQILSGTWACSNSNLKKKKNLRKCFVCPKWTYGSMPFLEKTPLYLNLVSIPLEPLQYLS